MVIERLASGALSLTTLRMIARHLTAENHRALVPAASGKTKNEVEGLLAAWFPQDDVAQRIRKVPARGPAASPAAVPGASPVVPGAPPVVLVASTTDSIVAPPIAPPAAVALPGGTTAVVRPLAPSRYEIRFTAQRGDARQAAARTGSPLARSSEWGPGRGHRPRADPARRRSRAQEARSHRPSPSCAGRAQARPRRIGQGEASGLGERRWPVCLRFRGRAFLWRDALRRVPPHAAVGGGRFFHCREHPAPLPCPQRPRSRPVLRARRAAHRIGGRERRGRERRGRERPDATSGVVPERHHGPGTDPSCSRTEAGLNAQ
jgi:hypothetical protein